MFKVKFYFKKLFKAFKYFIQNLLSEIVKFYDYKIIGF